MTDKYTQMRSNKWKTLCGCTMGVQALWSISCPDWYRGSSKMVIVSPKKTVEWVNKSRTSDNGYTLCYISVTFCNRKSLKVVWSIWQGRSWYWPDGGTRLKESSSSLISKPHYHYPSICHFTNFSLKQHFSINHTDPKETTLPPIQKSETMDEFKHISCTSSLIPDAHTRQ